MSTSTEIRVRDATRADLPAITAIEQLAFTDPWTAPMFGTHLRSPNRDVFLIVEDLQQQLMGYAITRVIDEEAELLNIATHPERRRMGVAAMLLDATMQRCATLGARDMFLEVRVSNTAAHALYGGRGFVPIGRRKGYYRSPREDALVLRTMLAGPDGGRKTIRRADPGLPDVSRNSILSAASQLPRQEII